MTALMSYSLKPTKNIKLFLESYFEILYNFYTANKLKINPNKTKYIIICRKTIRPIYVTNLYECR